MSQNPNVQERTPDAPVDLDDLSKQLRSEASEAEGRAALTLTPSIGGPLKQTVVYVASGQSFDENGAPGPASIVVLTGTGTLSHGGEDVELVEASWTPLPMDPYEVHADDDMLLLLTVVPNP